MKLKIFLHLILILLIVGCQEDKPSNYKDKIRFDMDAIDDHGLEIGSENKTSIYYQFCIPDSDSLAMEVFKTEPSVDIYLNNSGEVGCGENERMCMGHSHPNGWKTRLIRLAKLPYVGYIDRVSYPNK